MNVEQQVADERFALAVACGATPESAARSVGLSEGDACRRAGAPDFKERVCAIRADMVQRTSGMLTAAAGEAVKTLLVLQKETLPPAVRLGAAKAVLEIGVKLRELSELEVRLAELEQRVQTNNNRATFAA